MLVVGINMVPIMQNSFASKKSDFKKAEREPNTNINTNTNSADSSSSSSATAENTNNITNSATASQSQSQLACAVAVTCPGGSTTVTPPTTPCNPPTVGGHIVIPTDDTCIAGLPAGSTLAQLRAFENDCLLIPTSTLIIRPDNSATCTFSSTPPT